MKTTAVCFLGTPTLVASAILLCGCMMPNNSFWAKPDSAVSAYSSNTPSESDDSASSEDTDAEVTPADRNFAELVSSLIDDALDLMPAELANRIAPDDNYDALMEGAFEFELGEMTFLSSIAAKDLGAQAAYVVQRIYGENLGAESSIPQTIYFERINFQTGIVTGVIAKEEQDIVGSQNPDRDKYTLCLAVVVNLWIDNFNMNTLSTYEKPREGIYLRDDENTLYLYEVEEM